MIDMAVKKLSVALDENVAARVAAVAERDGVSVSAWLNAAAERALNLDDGLAAMREWEAEHGQFTPDEHAWAESVLRDAGLGHKRA